MNRPANPNKEAADIIRSAAGVASGHGELGLANWLWAFEERLREEGRARLERALEDYVEQTLDAVLTMAEEVCELDDDATIKDTPTYKRLYGESHEGPQVEDPPS